MFQTTNQRMYLCLDINQEEGLRRLDSPIESSGKQPTGVTLT